MSARQYICLLRGINVGGQKSMQMSDLRDCFEKWGFQDILTYIQSGNILFRANESSKTALKAIIEAGIKKEYGFDVETFVTTGSAISKMIAGSPYRERSLRSDEKIYFTLLSSIPEKENVRKLIEFSEGDDQITLAKDVVYALIRKGYNKTKFSNNFLEKILKVKATTRNLETMKKLASLSKELR